MVRSILHKSSFVFLSALLVAQSIALELPVFQIIPTAEAATPQCRDGVDNDGDGRIDFSGKFTGSVTPVTVSPKEGVRYSRAVTPGETLSITDISGIFAYWSNQITLPCNQVYLNTVPTAIYKAPPGVGNFLVKFVSSNGTVVSTHLLPHLQGGTVVPANASKMEITFPDESGKHDDNLGSCSFNIRQSTGGNFIPADPECSSPDDDSEAPAAQCSDGIDNDGDGATDMNDFSCSSPADNDETNPKSACQDGVDNDADGLTDFPQDPGCSSRQDNDEFDAKGRLDVTKTVSPTSTAGQHVTYNFSVKNIGQATVAGVNAFDFFIHNSTGQRIDPPFSFVSSNGANCTFVPAEKYFLCPIGDLAANQTKTFTMTFAVPANNQSLCNASIMNQVDAWGANNDLTISDWDKAPTTVSCAALTTTLAVEKTGSSTAQPGQPMFYNIKVRNTGTATANNVKVIDIVPFGTSFVASGSDSSCSLQNFNGVQRVECTPFNLNAGAEKNITVKFMVNTGQLACNATLRNQADVESSNAAFAWDDATATIFCGQTSSSSSSSVAQCRDGIDNDGDGRIDYPNDYGCDSSDDTTEGPNPECSDGFDNADTEDNLADAQDAGCYNNGIYDPRDPSENNAASNGSSSSSATSGTDVTIQKTGASTISQGSQITYNILVTNIGGSEAQQVVVNDTIPNGTIFLSSNGASCTQNTATNVTCTLGNINGGQSKSFSLTFATNSLSCNSTITNSATVSSTNEQFTGNNASQTVFTFVQCGGSSSSQGGADFSIEVDDDEDEVAPGDSLTYVITVKNRSNQSFNNVTVTNELPKDVNFEDCSPNCSENGRTQIWSGINFDGNETKTFTVEGEVDEDADEGDELRDTARVFDKSDTDETEVEDDDNDDDDDLEIEVTNEASTSEVFPGGMIEYTIRVRNTGNTTIEDITIENILPAGVSVIDDGDADRKSGGKLIWEIDELEEDDDITVRFRVSVPSWATPGTILRNEVRVTNDDDDVDERASAFVSVIGFMPQTGFMGSVGGSAFLTPIHKTQGEGSSSVPAAMALSIIGLALGGAGAGRKFLGL